MRFEVHWCAAGASRALHGPGPASTRLAIWPAPVNPDECFKAAGFDDFADSDAGWDAQARTLLQRVIEALGHAGPAHLLTPPLARPAPWALRLFRRGQTLPVTDQLELPMLWDSLPRCTVAFGGDGASITTGDGHYLMWVSLPATVDAAPARFVDKIAQGWPRFHTPLHWQHLLSARHAPDDQPAPVRPR